jgi:hypothetical protein
MCNPWNTKGAYSRLRALMVGVALLVGSTCNAADTPKQYEANWASLDARPMPAWFAGARFGIFVCWGPYRCTSAITGATHGLAFLVAFLHLPFTAGIGTGRNMGRAFSAWEIPISSS